ncbi:hypothetical protein KM031_02035 [Gemmobacter fulvus]|uniref:RiboL-PSP-HEPN domain-containing protein n=1 Tax=Gemmobacter fulvus TaxID=2840474 RepID=A0A975P6F4_9RHOB|nr:hypothetical protein [Gemmobacter fulvus]MBT9244931.1 hypothetical protein [Gemmobacter fulvus]QWK90715.1 hypothetical protein KM031_02035 [Gemmobacter fulvus]
MQQALDAFEQAMVRARELHGLHASLSAQLTAAVDLSDILRSEIVMAVSAFDFFIHELTRLGMLECYGAIRNRTDAFNKFPIPIGVMIGVTPATLEAEIRSRHGYVSFQQPDKVADAVRLFSPVSLWVEVGASVGVDAKTLKTNFGLIVDRRNKIAHEADIDPSYPNQRWPIDRAQVEYTFDLVERVARAIFAVTV